MITLKDFGVTKHVGFLNNGTRVVLFHRPNMPIDTNLLFLAGSRNDPIGKEGLAHFTEHIIFKKTKKFSSETQTFEFLERLGGFPNAFTWIDLLGIDAYIALRSDYPSVCVFFNELLNNQRFGKGTVEKERNVILDEKRLYDSNPELYIEILANRVFLQGTDMGRDILGSEDSIKSITWDDLKTTFDKRLNPEDMVILVAGDIDLDELLSMYNDIFSEGVVAKERVEKLNTPQLVRKEPVMIKKFGDASQIYLNLGFRTCPYVDEDTVVLSLIDTILAGGASSSLYRVLRIENALAYRVKVAMWGTRDVGVWAVNTATSKENLQKLLDLTCREFERVCEGRFTEKEIQLAKDKIIKSQITRMETSRSWVSFHMLGTLFGSENSLDLDQYLNEIEKVTLGDLKRVGKKYFKPGSWYLAMCGDVTEKDFKVNY